MLRLGSILRVFPGEILDDPPVEAFAVADGPVALGSV
jgi:hypothetical protein